MPEKIFVSYASDFKDTTARLVHALEKAGYDVWWDDYIPAGDAIQTAIEQQLDAADHVIVVWSASAITSEWVKAEAEYARIHGKLVTLHAPGFDATLLKPPFTLMRSRPADETEALIADLKKRSAQRHKSQLAAQVEKQISPGKIADDGFASFFLDNEKADKTPTYDTLPTWNLDALYTQPADEKIDQDLAEYKRRAAAFATQFEGKISNLNGDEIVAMMQEWEHIESISGRIVSYCYLQYDQDRRSNHGKSQYLKAQQDLTNASECLSFLLSELAEINANTLQSWFAENPAVEKYRYTFQFLKRRRLYVLDPESEAELSRTTWDRVTQWTNAYEDAILGAQIEFTSELGTQDHDINSVLDLMQRHDPDLRERAGAALSDHLAEMAPHQARYLAKFIEGSMHENSKRGLPTPEAARHIKNDIEESVVAALEQTIVAAAPRIAHRFFRQKARWLDVDKLRFFERHAVPPFGDYQQMSWKETAQACEAIFSSVAPELGVLVRTALTEGWVDAEIREGRTQDGYSHPTIGAAHPYLLTNTYGNTNDLIYLCRMMSHAVHQSLAAKQGEILSCPSLLVTNSIASFFETLAFAHIQTRMDEPIQKKFNLARFVENDVQTVFRQMMFYRFEKRVYRHMLDHGHLSRETIGQIWMQEHHAISGPAVEEDDRFRDFWCYLRVFVLAPFSTYSFAFGSLLGHVLYAQYLRGEAESSQAPFGERLVALMSAGGTESPYNLLNTFGIDLKDLGAWTSGLDMLERMIEQLEQDRPAL